MCDSRIKRALCFALVALLLCAGFFLTPQPAKAEDNDGLFRIRVMVVWEGGPKPDVQVQLTQPHFAHLRLGDSLARDCDYI
jgi:hypothetical protein